MLKNIFLFFIYPFFLNSHLSYTREYLLQTEDIPLNIYWISEDNILLSYPTNVADIYNLESGQKNRLDKCNKCVYGYDGEILRCEYINRNINTPQDPATTIYMYNSQNDLIFQQDLYHTLLPVVCKKEEILLRVNHPALQEKIFSLNTKSGELKNFQKQFKKVDIDGLPKYKNISISKKRIILLTNEGYLTVYKRE